MQSSLKAQAEGYEADPQLLQRVSAAGGCDRELWRARYRETPTSEYKYVQLPSVWKAFDPAARNAGLEALPAPSFRAPRAYK